MERHEKWNGAQIHVSYERIEINLKERGVLVHALDVGFPKQEGKGSNADEHYDGLKEYR